jgi:hypothetical protein
MSVLNGCVSAIVCNLVVEIFNISQCGLRDTTERSGNVTHIGMACYGAETLGNKFYVRRKTLRLLLVFCTGPFWYTQQLYFQHKLRLYISHGTDSILTRYDAFRHSGVWPGVGLFDSV